MSLIVAVLIMLLLAAVLLVITAPLRRAEREAAQEHGPDGGPAAPAPPEAEDELADESIADLEAAREAKYREIRDAELDFRTGKLAEEDFKAIDAELRREAIAILDRLERVCGQAPDAY